MTTLRSLLFPLLLLGGGWISLCAQPLDKPLARLSGEWNVYEQEGLRNRLSEKSQTKIVFSPIDNGNGLLVTIVRYDEDRLESHQGCWFFHQPSGRIYGQNGAQQLKGSLDDGGNLHMTVYAIGQEEPEQDFTFLWISDDLIRWEGKRRLQSGKHASYTRVLRRHL